jgi:hypothetical protein
MTKIFNEVAVKKVVKRAAPKIVPPQAETSFAHAVAAALNKTLRGSPNQADAVAKRCIPAYSGNQTLVVLLAMLYVRCDGIDCFEQL